MSKEQFKYFAFISYNSHDTQWGKRLKRKLVGYRMSATLCREHGWKRKPINPIFFAPTDIQPGGLSDELKSRLQDSRYLIVIGSPHSAQSEWVGREIAYFHSLGRAQNIHYFIVDGQPNSGPDTECFNPVIKQLGMPEILGANIHERVHRSPWLNRERAYVQLISKLLNVEFDAIWQSHRRLLRQRIAAWTVGSLTVLAALVGLWITGRPVDVEMQLHEVSAHNPNLPPLREAVVTIELDNETKTDTILSLDAAAHFRNIPYRSLGKPAHIMVASRAWLPIDTTLLLSKTVRLDFRRDPSYYGHIRFRFWDPNSGKALGNTKLTIGSREVMTDSEGKVSLFVPLEEQHASYRVETDRPLEDSILHMPCGEGTTLMLH